MSPLLLILNFNIDFMGYVTVIFTSYFTFQLENSQPIYLLMCYYFPVSFRCLNKTREQSSHVLISFRK